MGYLSAKDEGNQFFKHVPYFRDFTRSSGTFSLKIVSKSKPPRSNISRAEREAKDERRFNCNLTRGQKARFGNPKQTRLLQQGEGSSRRYQYV